MYINMRLPYYLFYNTGTKIDTSIILISVILISIVQIFYILFLHNALQY